MMLPGGFSLFTFDLARTSTSENPEPGLQIPAWRDESL